MYITLKADDDCTNDSDVICDLGVWPIMGFVGLWTLYNVFVQIGLWHFVEEAQDDK